MTKPASRAVRLADIRESLAIANEPLRDGRYTANAPADIRFLLDQVAALTASRARLRVALEDARNVIYRAAELTDSFTHRKQYLSEYRNANDKLTADDEALRALIGEG